MTNDINPIIVDGEPRCSIECPIYPKLEDDDCPFGRVDHDAGGTVSYRKRCWPGLLRQRDEALALAQAIEQAGAIVARSQCKMSVEHPVVTHRHAPIAQYAFKYVPIEVTCGECGAQFPLTELKSDASDDAYSDRVCPQCEAWDCCEVTYERMTEEMAREALNGRNT